MNYFPIHKENWRLAQGGETLAKIGDVIVWYPGGPAIMADGPIWLPADGRWVKMAAYPQLYRLVGQTWGDGTDKAYNEGMFALPKLTEDKRGE